MRSLLQYSALTISMLCILTSVFSQSYVHEDRINNSLLAPSRLAIDAQDNIYVTDPLQSSVIKYDSQGNLIQSYALNFNPLAITTTSTDIIVSSKSDGILYRLHANGSVTTFYEGCTMPVCIKTGTNGLIYVADSRLRHIKVLNQSGIVLNTFGSDTLVFPSSIAFDGANQRLLVAEHGGVGDAFQNCGGMMGSYGPISKVYSFDLQGNLLGSFGCHGNGDGEFDRVQGIAVGKCGDIFLAETFQGNINRFSSSFNYIDRYGSFGTDPGQLNVPIDIVFDSQQRMIVASLNNSALDVYTIEQTLPTSNIVNSDAILCAGATSTIEINFTGTPPWDFTITRNGADPLSYTTSDSPYYLPVSIEGIYEVTSLSDQSASGNCFSGSAVIEVLYELPTATLSQNTIAVCEGNSAEVQIDLTGRSPWTFTITEDGIIHQEITTDITPFKLSTTSAGVYAVNSIMDAGSCTGGTVTGSTEVVINPAPTASISSSINEICSGETALLEVIFTGNGPWSFVYSIDGALSPVINSINSSYAIMATQQGTYQLLQATDQTCTSSIDNEVVEIIVHDIPTALLHATSDTVCEGEITYFPVTFTGTGPWSVSWSLNDAENFSLENITANPAAIPADVTGDYMLTAVSDANCGGYSLGTTAVLSVEPTPVSTFTMEQNGLSITCTNTSINATSFSWDFGDGTFSSEMNPVHTYTASGVYTISLIASNTLCGSDVSTLTADLLVQIENNELNELVNFYPNPANNELWIELSSEANSISTLQIYSISGQLVYSATIEIGIHNLKIDLSGIGSGIYSLKFTNSEISRSGKLLIQG